MTCLVAWRGKDATMVGTDAQWSAGKQKGEMPEGKMWRHGRFVVAAAGNVRAMQLLQYGPQFDEAVSDSGLVQHLIQKWVPQVFTNLNEAGQLRKDEDKTAQVEVEMLVVSRRKIVRIGGDLSVIEEKLRYAAGGSGEEIALGYLAAKDNVTDRNAYSARTIVRGALMAASQHNTGVSPPFYTEVVR